MKYRNILIVLLIITLSINCNKLTSKKTENMDKLSQNNKNQEEKLFYLDYNLLMNYTVLINDVKIVSNNKIGPVSGMEYLNEWILNSGTQTITLEDKNLSFVDRPLPDNIFKSMNMSIYSSDKNEDNIKLEKALDFPDIPTPNPYVFKKVWTFDANVPYNVDGWKNGQDLSLIDEKELEEMVVRKFEYYHDLLQKGKTEKLMLDFQNIIEEQTISTYNGSTDFADNIEFFYKKQINKLLPLKNYKVKLFGNGKLVTLERMEVNSLYYGKSALLGLSSDKKTLYENYIYLYMPKGKDSLEAIRLIINNDTYTPSNDD